MRVLRLLLRPALVMLSCSAMLLLGYVGLLHARPYEDGGLRDFLVPPDGCPAPCWAGIRPGVTTVDQALILLDAHEWIITPRLADNFQRSNGWGAIYWTWNDQQPAFIDMTRISYLHARNDVIEQVMLRVSAPYGDLFLTLGKPQLWAYSQFSEQTEAHHFAFFDHQLMSQTLLRCPVFTAGLYRTSVLVMLNDPQLLPSNQGGEFSDSLHRPPC